MNIEKKIDALTQSEQRNAALLYEWIKEYVKEEEAIALTEFLGRSQKNNGQLYAIYESLWKQEKKLYTVDSKYALMITEEGSWLTDGNGRVEHSTEDWKKIIAKGIAFLEELLPLGSVVELKKEYMEGQIPALKEAGKVRLVITERYLSLTGNSYFPYAGVPYPIGTFGEAQRLMFSPALIEAVLSRGFSDEQEEEYQFLMKREYLLEKNMDMCGFEAEEERAVMKQLMEERHGR